MPPTKKSRYLAMRLRGFFEDTAKSLHGAVSQLVPLAAHLPLTAETLSGGRWKPRKERTKTRVVICVVFVVWVVWAVLWYGSIGGMEVWQYGGMEVWRYGGMEVWWGGRGWSTYSVQLWKRKGCIFTWMMVLQPPPPPVHSHNCSRHCQCLWPFVANYISAFDSYVHHPTFQRTGWKNRPSNSRDGARNLKFWTLDTAKSIAWIVITSPFKALLGYGFR